jgi:hypothetical protein
VVRDQLVSGRLASTAGASIGSQTIRPLERFDELPGGLLRPDLLPRRRVRSSALPTDSEPPRLRGLRGRTFTMRPNTRP